MLRCMLIGMAIGVATEVSARQLSLWVYRQPVTPVVNVIVVFGLVMGGVASAVPAVGFFPAFVIAFVIGLAYEIANLTVFDWWYFPGERLAFIRGHFAIVTVVAALWGAVPLVAAGVNAAVFHS